MSDLQEKCLEGIAPPTQKSGGGFMGKFLNNAWNTVKSGVGKASKFIGDSAVGKAGKWAWKNKAPILNVLGGAAQAFGTITGNPAVAGFGKGMIITANGIKEGEAKAAIEKAIAERQPNPLGNGVWYSDFPRIYYGREPAGYKIYQKRNKLLEEAREQLAQLKSQNAHRKRKKSRKAKK